MNIQRGALASAALLAMVSLVVSQPASADPFKLGIEERGYVQDPTGQQGGYDYPAPQAIPTPTLQGGAEQSHKKKAQPALKPQQAQPAARPPVLNAGVTQSVQLPRGFMGAWMVSGLRKEVNAQPQFQAGASQIFAEQTQNVWNITGDPSSGYAFTNDVGVKSAIYVDKVQGDTAFIRYQHPIKNTMAQEAIVMQLVPGGAQFNGLEKISIIKQGEPGPRAQVTYQLMGRRR